MIDKETIDRLDDPTVTVERAVFLDRNGNWAKRWEDVYNVWIDFSDDHRAILEPADFRTLSREQQAKVIVSSSSPLPT